MTDLISIRSDDETLIDWLRDRDAFCPLCQYNLRNLTSSRCPECGNRLRLGVALVDPYLKAWITLMAGFCAGAGIGILFIFLVAREGWPGEGPLVNFAIVWEILMIPIAAVALITRRKYQRLTRSTQWLLALIGIGLVVFGLILFLAEIR